MSKFLETALLLTLLIFSASAQNHTISGYLSDAQSGERLIGVNIYLEGTNFGTTTNTYGFYSLTAPKGEYNLVASYIGYASKNIPINLNKNLELDLSISASSEELEEVEIVAEETPARQVQMSTVRLGVPDIKKIPAFMGEVDIIRAIQLLPGVQSGSEGTTGFYVRGGSPDQNLILLDGVPVYNASHLFGFFSVFNADAIKNVELIKGGFPARYGGRLSSVLEINMKEGNMKEFRGSGSIGLIASKLTLEGPIVKDKTSFVISGRRTYYDLLVKPFLPEGQNTGYYFGDLNAKVNHVFSRKDRLYASFYSGIDDFYFEETYNDGFEENETAIDTRWGNRTAALRWNHLFNDKLFSNLTATYTRYIFETGFSQSYRGPSSNSEIGQNYSSSIEDWGLRYDLEYSLNSRHSLRYGLSYTYHTFLPGVSQLTSNFDDQSIDSIINLSDPIYSHDLFAYLEDDWNLNEHWRLNYGLHYSHYLLNGANYQQVQPRLSARYLLQPNWSLKGSYALMNQYIHLLSNTSIGLPTDLWVSSTDKVKPQLSQQIAVGSTRGIKGNDYEVSIEAYYKWMENLIEYKEGASFFSNSDWERNVETDGRGETYGIEFLFRKNEGATTGWLGYTLAWSNRQFSNLNEGRVFPYKYDRRHDISLVVNHTFSEKFDMGLTWVFGSGNTFTAPVSKYLLLNRDGFGGFPYPQVVDRYTDRNALRMPSYHRLDLGFNFHKETRWGRRTWNVSVYNAYNRQNPFFLLLQEGNGDDDAYVEQVSLFPIIPSIAYIFEF